MNHDKINPEERTMNTMSSCNEPVPLVSLDGDESKASVLNYNIPASTTFTVRVFVPVDVPDDFWNQESKTLPVGSPFVEIEPPSSGSGIGVVVTPVPEKIKPFLDYLEVQPPWEKELTDPRPPAAWKEKAKQVEAEVKKIGTAHPSLKMLADLNVAMDLEIELMSQTLDQTQKKIQTENVYLKNRPIYNPMTLLNGLAAGKQAVWDRTFYGRNILRRMAPKVKKATPRLFVIEELEIATFLGDYGAGKTVQTFSLLPGEKTTISIKTWRTESSEQEITQNILDSYSEESANEFESQVENEFSTSMQSEDTATEAFSETHSEKNTTTKSGKVGGSFKLGVDGFGIGGGGGYSTTTTEGSEDINESKSSASSTRTNTADTLAKAMDKHVNQSSTARKHEVNVESKSKVSVEEGEEETITRELQNINHSRVLNFVFRALNQEFLTITYLKDVSFGFTKGVPGDGVATKLDNLDSFLSGRLINTEAVKKIRNMILEHLLAVYDHNGNPQPFVKQDEITLPALDNGTPKKLKYWHKNPDLFQEWEGKRVDGVILNTAKRILPTDALIVEALLGQGEALDCYNMRLQNAATEKADLANERERIALQILEGGPDMQERAEAFARMFNPQMEAKDE